MSEHIDARFGRVEVDELVIRGGSHVLTASKTPSGEGVGIWLRREGDSGNLIAIYKQDDQLAIGLYGPDSSKGLTICLSIDSKGEPFLQMIACDDTLVQVTPSSLRKSS